MNRHFPTVTTISPEDISKATDTITVWRRLLDASYRHDDEDWGAEERADFLNNLLIELMHPGEGSDVPAVTDEQLTGALDRLDVAS